jgi:hypothetical protein
MEHLPRRELGLDRFAFEAGLEHPARDEQVAIVPAQRRGHPTEQLDRVISTGAAGAGARQVAAARCPVTCNSP